MSCLIACTDSNGGIYCEQFRSVCFISSVLIGKKEDAASILGRLIHCIFFCKRSAVNSFSCGAIEISPLGAKKKRASFFKLVLVQKFRLFVGRFFECQLCSMSRCARGFDSRSHPSSTHFLQETPCLQN